MSVKLSSFVWDGCASTGMKISKVAIMARLADFSSDEGICWPSVETIARQIGAGVSTVRTALGELEKEGWISKQQRRNGNRNASNIYQLNVEKLRASAQPPESERSKSDPSKSEPSESKDKSTFHPPESGGDPSLNSKHDPSDKTSCQSDEQTDPMVVITDQAKQVLTHLNLATGSKYQPGKTSLDGIRARLGEGFTADELVLVVDYANAKWGNDLKMTEYLRPITLFSPSKFPGYLQAAGKWGEAGRPACVNGKWVKDGQELGTNNRLRDKAFKRFLGSGLPVREPTKLELTVASEAAKAGVKKMRADFAASKWNSLWAEVEQRIGGNDSVEIAA